ncbi:MAG: hypothetical protein V2A58_11055 [Planctomycetota bacterium]
MLEKVKCPSCGMSLKVADSHLGGKVLCPSCQSIVVVGRTVSPWEDSTGGSEEGSTMEGGTEGKHSKRGLMVSSAFGFLVIVAVATLSGWYSVHLSKQHHFRKHYYEPALDLLSKITEAVEKEGGESPDDLFAADVNETKRGILLTTAAELQRVEIVESPRIVSRDHSATNEGERVELEVFAKDKETGTPRVITLRIESKDGKFQLADLMVEPRGEEAK